MEPATTSAVTSPLELDTYSNNTEKFHNNLVLINILDSLPNRVEKSKAGPRVSSYSCSVQSEQQQDRNQFWKQTEL